MNSIADKSIIALDKFIQSTRDSGYKSTASAVSELVDNSVQAGAKKVLVLIEADAESNQGIRVAVVDDGSGMDRLTLTQALRFGGSTRFNDRSGLGRFGMGLPNASLSQARKVGVFSWRGGKGPIYSYLDVDEISTGALVSVPNPVKVALPEWLQVNCSASGTAVVWESCDRLDHRRISTLERKLHAALGRIFRYLLQGEVRIEINDTPVRPVDPLFLDPRSEHTGAQLFEDVWTAEFYADPDNPNSPIGSVEVVFAELPVHAWQGLSNEEKRNMGISNNAGVSVVRGHREVDFGWFFMGSKRRENYDDWWRCEVRFDPVLDEAFGITHTKQQIRPKEHLLDGLQPYVESIAKALNGRARQAHNDVKVVQAVTRAEELAKTRDKKLKPLPAQPKQLRSRQEKELEQLARRHESVTTALEGDKSTGTTYRIIEDDLGDACFFRPLVSEGTIVGVLNPRHRFFKNLYRPIMENKELAGGELVNALQLVLLAAARAEASFSSRAELEVIERFRQEWSQAMDALLGSR